MVELEAEISPKTIVKSLNIFTAFSTVLVNCLLDTDSFVNFYLTMSPVDKIKSFIGNIDRDKIKSIETNFNGLAR